MKLFASQKFWKTILKNIRLFLIVPFLLSAHQLNAKAEWTILVYAQAKNNLSNLIEKGDVNLLIDCTKASEIDVVGINALAIIYKQLRSKNGTLTIHLKKDSHLSKMLHLTKFEKVFTLIYP